MNDQDPSGPDSISPSVKEAVDRLRSAARDGRDWTTALVEAMALWTDPHETLDGRHFNYFIGGEAFDWMLLAERLFMELDGIVDDDERELLLFSSRLPGGMDESTFKNLLGVDKSRGHLNFYYGVTVEEALQVAVEQEVQKRYLSNGVQVQGDLAEEACVKIYGATRSDLFAKFRDEMGHESRDSISLGENREFTYWLFKYRVHRSDKARVASDTKKGLEQLQRMTRASAVPAGA